MHEFDLTGAEGICYADMVTLGRIGTFLEDTLVALRKTAMPTERVYSLEQVAEWLGFNRKTVVKWIESGELVASKLGRAYRIRQADLDDFMRRKQIKPKQ
jgi:excisionase family DNA binding protein